mmetsp:Transcript_7784/g.22271  ORF Transcript_7784/g.22271 Transcript_7784/m.22271 type:complete len:272 (-) Transcript_7784:697-1512(-)
MLVGNPFAILAVEVAVQHCRHSVDTHAVNVVAIDPEQGGAEQVRTDLILCEVENTCSPLHMLALPWVFVFVSRRPVVIHQGPLVLAEVGGDIVHDDPDAGLMQRIHEEFEIFGGAQLGIARIMACHLVSPRTFVGVMRQRQQLKVIEIQRVHVLDERIHDVAVIQDLALRCAAPRGKVYLVDGHRLPPQLVAFRETFPALDPCPIAPSETGLGECIVVARYHGSMVRRRFELLAERVHLQGVAVVQTTDLIHVLAAIWQGGVLAPGQKHLP